MNRNRPRSYAFLGMLLTFVAAAAAFAQAEYSITDAGAELAVSIDPDEAMVWLNTFPVDPAGPYIDTLRVAYGRAGIAAPLNSLPVRILLYEDANGGSPQDAVLRWSFTTTIENANTEVLNVYRLPATLIRGNLVAGALFENATALPKPVGALDTTPPSLAGRSYVGFAAAIDPGDLGAIPAGQWDAIEGFGAQGNFRIEAHGRIVDDGAVVLKVVKARPQGPVELGWIGSQPAYDVERGSRPDFSDDQLLAPGIAATTYDDPSLPDGKTWFYRVR